MEALRKYKCICVFYILLSWNNEVIAQRQDILLNDGWKSIATDRENAETKFSNLPSNKMGGWINVSVPHNWDSYEGYRRLLHGNRHGDSWYKQTIRIKQSKTGKRIFLYFEGVGSYASVFLNNKKVGEHAGGRTTFTVDVTDVIRTDGTENELAVRAYHPANIKDLPWVCGGCSDERGFSEGSQPMGIFRPVHLVVTNDLRIEPFGVHAWAKVSSQAIQLSINTTIKNYSGLSKTVHIIHLLKDHSNNTVATLFGSRSEFKAKDSLTIQSNETIATDKIRLWSPADPFLYKIVSLVQVNEKIVDSVITDFGFRTVQWKTPTHQFLINGTPVFINGVAEYEHLLGQSHAFSPEQIISRMKWLKLAGFNAFRDGHQPHNLLYGKLCNQYGILWWTQLSAHVWYDSPEFRNNFKQLLREWVIERRNNPSVVLWGLQNESKIPEDFAAECTELIRQLDPTASSQRLVTTCNGGSGTDWDVPQNWTGTYGGDPITYATDVKKQVLIGEYGAWRTLDLHTEGGFVQNGILSEDRMVQLMEQKIRLAESVKDSSAGQFFWLLTSHDNPGRVQGGEGLRELDRIGPVNYKGLLTPWEEPTDAFYMYRSNYAAKETEPMVYIVSHTWPNRWTRPGIKDSIYVYSNCDEVELFNDINNLSLGKRKRNGIGTHFQWDKVNIQYNLLYAVGYVNGKAVARDTIALNHLPESPSFKNLLNSSNSIIQSASGYEYLYRINCGGPDYVDKNKNKWAADIPYKKGYYGSRSWANEYTGIPDAFASQRRTFSPIKGTTDWKLFQTFRYGKDKLEFEFPLPDGDYRVELYFIEPWLGIGGGMDCTGMRLFDVAINGKTAIKDLDIWKEVGSNSILKKVVQAKVKGGRLIISFPESKSGQAIISAIAIASIKKNIQPASAYALVPLQREAPYQLKHWLDIGDRQFSDDNISFRTIPSNLFGSQWLQLKKEKSQAGIWFMISDQVDIFVGVDTTESKTLSKDYENTGTQIETDENGSRKYQVYGKRYAKQSQVAITAGQIVIIKPVSNMQPAYDLKPVTPYRTNVAILSQGVQKEMFGNRECAVIKTIEKVNIQWPVQTGVADIYSVTMKYFWPGEKEVKGRLQLIGAGNTMMMDIPVQFTFTRDGKWNQFTVNTGNMINAGHYTVKLVTENANGLAISSIEIQ